jgi:hypothetical protein
MKKFNCGIFVAMETTVNNVSKIHTKSVVLSKNPLISEKVV